MQNKKSRSPKKPRALNTIYKILLLILPAILYFSYWPVIRLGGNETMNFELSLPLIWLVIFDLLGLVLLFREKLILKIWRETTWEKWLWLSFPIWVSLTTIWSLNLTRGILTAEILWLIYLAIIIIIFATKSVAHDFEKFKRSWLKWFFGASLFACAWCWLQCILDLAGVPQSSSLLCDGCVATTFGFPHPNGFAIEPQFMGNLLLAPTILSGIYLFGALNKSQKSKFGLLFFALATTLFLTFSRGAIYAFLVALIFWTVFEIFRSKKFRALLIWPIVILSFIFTLNAQGLMSEFGPTNDTYMTGVSKVLNHLSLGIIDFRSTPEPQPQDSQASSTPEISKNLQTSQTANLSDNSSNAISTSENVVATFDGYVEESTNIRVELTSSAISVWRETPKNLFFGVGLGGAGQALFNSEKTSSPKEIVQNEYASLLLETGLIGIAFLILTLVLVLRTILKSPAPGALLTILLAFGIALCFFSGFPNALHIYLLPAVLFCLF